MNQNFSIVSIQLLLFLLLAFSQNGMAQLIKSKEDKYDAAEHIVALQGGTLVVRLVSKHKNITAIEELLGHDEVSKNTKKQLQKRLYKMLIQQDQANKDIVFAFSEFYHFSNYLVIYDTAMVHLLAEKPSGYFLNEDLAIDTSISINFNTPVYFLRYGQGDVADTNNFEGFLISDSDGNEPPKPFPYFVKAKHPPQSLIDAFIGNSEAITPNLIKMVKKLNNNFTNYYMEAKPHLELKQFEATLKKQREEMEALKKQLEEEQEEN